MAEIIPMLDTPRQTLILTLGGQEARLTVWWQPIDSGWYGSLESPPGRAIVTSRRINSGSGLIGQTRTPFVGDIFCVASGIGVGEPALHAWESTHTLVYT